MFLFAVFVFISATLIYVFLSIAIVYHIQEYLPPTRLTHQTIVFIFFAISFMFWLLALFSLLAIPR